MKGKAVFVIMLVLVLVGGGIFAWFYFNKKKEPVEKKEASIEIEPLQLNEFGDYIVLSDSTAISKF